MMIFYNVTRFFFFLLILNVTNAQVASVKHYQATCKIYGSLQRFEQCDEWSSLGNEAITCAFDQAMYECEVGMNVDCIEVASKVWSDVKRDTLNARSCNANVTVRGYSLRTRNQGRK